MRGEPLLRPPRRNRPTQEITLNPNVVIGVGTIAVAGLFAAFVAILVTTNPPSIIPEPGFPNFTGSIYQEHVCPCKNDWPLATNERIISNEVFAQSGSQPDARGLSSMVPFWGQFIDHDIVRSESDPSLGFFEITLVPGSNILNLTRNAFAIVDGCRSPENFITPLIDGGTIYGDILNPEVLDDIRVPGQCELVTTAGNLLPVSTSGMSFLSGDPRNSETVVLTSLHTLWMREHNRLCGEIASVYPDWTAEQRFWKARQVVVAKIQRITYREWLPQLLGTTMWSGIPKKDDPQMVAEFSVSAFRIGHDMIPANVGPFPLEDLFFNITKIQQNGIEPFLQGAYQTPSETADAHVVDALRNFLFGPAVGEDLVTRNLFRAREQEVGTYVQVANCYGNTSPEPALYEDPDVGLFNETIPAGSSLPYTVGLIVSEQFQRLERHDPQFYTKIRGNLGPYFAQQVDITTLGRVIRDNTELTPVPVNVFRV